MVNLLFGFGKALAVAQVVQDPVPVVLPAVQLLQLVPDIPPVHPLQEVQVVVVPVVVHPVQVLHVLGRAGLAVQEVQVVLVLSQFVQAIPPLVKLGQVLHDTVPSVFLLQFVQPLVDDDELDLLGKIPVTARMYNINNITNKTIKAIAIIFQ
jgi:hypothetical protein